MTLIRGRPWEIPEREATPEEVYLGRRRFLLGLGLAGLGVAGGAVGATGSANPKEGPAKAGTTGPPQGTGEKPVQGASGTTGAVKPSAVSLYPAKRNPAYTLDRPVTDEATAARYNNFYEFTMDKNVHDHVGAFKPSPWTVEITGLVAKKQTLDLDALLKRMPIEERLYRHRCVEAWAMAVPWTGFPLKALLDLAGPLGSARYVRMLSFKRPDEAPGQRNYTWYRWPYYEGLTMAEANHELAFMATGIYGHALPKQHGAPIRLVVPWKYGFKSIKSVVKIELIAEQPPTFWNDQAPTEYDFLANVNPKIPHPRWSQAEERMIDTGEKRPTQPFNGYGALVEKLYT